MVPTTVQLKVVFGVDFQTSEVVGCKMCYKNDVNKASLILGVSFRDEFKNICNKMCSVATVTQYNEQKKQLDKIANLFPDITR